MANVKIDNLASEIMKGLTESVSYTHLTLPTIA